MCSQYFSIVLDVSGYMHDKVAIGLESFFGKCLYKRLIYKSFYLIAFFMHFRRK